MRFLARKLQVKKVSVADASTFVAEHHRQGSTIVNFKIKSVGLYNDNELLAVAQFTTPRTAEKRRKYTTELLRLAFKKDVRIPGGASKLIKFYIKEYRPADIFTYQDTTGETTDVYLHAGMILVSQAKKKQYLVAAGKTLATATRKEALGMAYAIRYGPDRILGTKLGEVLREDGVRKSNRDLFTDELGWHVEETSGDRVYEWVDPQRTYYTYKLSATDSDKYYYGVSHIKKANATLEDCSNDSYLGSGGAANTNNKFRNWKALHKNTILKEILELFPRQAPAYLAETSLISDLWKIDPKCLNSIAGGRDGGALARTDISTIATCSIHGVTKHNGQTCMRCSALAKISMKQCEIHGLSKHNGATCFSCQNNLTVSHKECPIHGLTKFQGSACPKCSAAKDYRSLKCVIHGLTSHYKTKCVACKNEALITLHKCSIHGISKHIGASCYKCAALNKIQESVCSTHGLTPHQGQSCLKCKALTRFTKANCKVHGKTLFSGTQCQLCHSQKSVSLKLCPIHGETKHQGDRCSKCVNKALISMKVCPVHGESKHRGLSCYMCITDRKRLKSVQ